MSYLLAIWSWISAHPLEVMVICWAIFNVAWAQLPQPKNPALAKLWNGLHAALQLVVTPATSKGTFQLPWLVNLILKAMLGVVPEKKDPPSSSGSSNKPTATDAGTTNGTGTA